MTGGKIAKQVRTRDLCPGFVIARDVYNSRGQLVLRKGMALTSGMIQQLERFEIDGALIETEEERPSLDSAALEAEQRKVEDLIERKFRYASPDDRVMTGLKEVFKQYWKERVLHGR